MSTPAVTAESPPTESAPDTQEPPDPPPPEPEPAPAPEPAHHHGKKHSKTKHPPPKGRIHSVMEKVLMSICTVLIILLFVGVAFRIIWQPKVYKGPRWLKAHCEMIVDRTQNYSATGPEGDITFGQLIGDNLTIIVNIRNIPGKDGKNGMHVHSVGNIASCATTGGHYNPEKVTHGDQLDDVRHVGDLGNWNRVNGEIHQSKVDTKASLFGKHSIIGRAVVLHAGEDDLGKGGDDGSKTSGNAGARIGCCVIGIVDKTKFIL